MLIRALATALTVSLVVGCSGTPTPPATAADAADLVILNGKVHVANEANTVAQAVAVKGNTILRTGTTNEIKALAGPSTRVIDARGGTVTPGFNDSHVHFVEGGLALKQVDLAGLTTLREAERAGELTVRTYLATRGVPGITEADVDVMDVARASYGDDPTVHTGVVYEKK